MNAEQNIAYLLVLVVTMLGWAAVVMTVSYTVAAVQCLTWSECRTLAWKAGFHAAIVAAGVLAVANAWPFL